MTRRHEHHARVVTAFVRIPQPLEDGRVRCNGCGAVVGLTPKTRRTMAHKTPAGEPCAYLVSYADPVEFAELPPVVVPPTPQYYPPREPAERLREPSRLDAGSNCEDCGKWLPGERSVCGACSVKRNANRRKR